MDRHQSIKKMLRHSLGRPPDFIVGKALAWNSLYADLQKCGSYCTTALTRAVQDEGWRKEKVETRAGTQAAS